MILAMVKIDLQVNFMPKVDCIQRHSLSFAPISFNKSQGIKKFDFVEWFKKQRERETEPGSQY